MFFPKQEHCKQAEDIERLSVWYEEKHQRRVEEQDYEAFSWREALFFCPQINEWTHSNEKQLLYDVQGKEWFYAEQMYKRRSKCWEQREKDGALAICDRVVECVAVERNVLIPADVKMICGLQYFGNGMQVANALKKPERSCKPQNSNNE